MVLLIFIMIVLVSQQQYFSVHILGPQVWNVLLISVVKGMLWQESVPTRRRSKLEALLVLVHRQGKALSSKMFEYIWIWHMMYECL